MLPIVIAIIVFAVIFFLIVLFIPGGILFKRGGGQFIGHYNFLAPIDNTRFNVKNQQKK